MPTSLSRVLAQRLLTASLLLFFFMLAAGGHFAHGAAPFYEGKTIRMIVGTSPGGGYDTYTRAVENSQDLDSLSHLQVAACLSGMGVYSAWTVIHHGIVHAVSSAAGE